MSLKKKMLAVAAVSALTAATAVPAMAFENEFHGMYRFKGVMSNIQNAGGQTVTPGYDPQTRTFMEQRARLMYNAKASDDLKLVTHFELDYSKFGDASYAGQNVTAANNTTGYSAGTRNTGAALGSDEINIETKNIYLDFNLPTATKVNFKVGMQPWVDSYGGLVVNADMAGVLASAKYGNFANSLGFFRFDDRANKVAGKQTRDFFVVDSKLNLNKDVRVGGSYYLLNDDLDKAAGSDPARVATSSIVHMLGLNAQAKLAAATVDGGILYQFGTAGNAGDLIHEHISAFGGYAGSKVAAGPGTFNIVAAYTSGAGNAFQSIGNTTSTSYSENTFYGANMHILLRSKYEINSGGYVIGSSNNKNQGMIVGSLGYDMKFTDRLYGNANIGFGAVARDPAEHESKYLGTEVNAEIGYKLTDNLNASLVGAFMKLGDYFEGTATAGKNPNDPFYSTIMLNYVF